MESLSVMKKGKELDGSPELDFIIIKDQSQLQFAGMHYSVNGRLSQTVILLTV